MPVATPTAFTAAKLKTELTTDPAGMGYAALPFDADQARADLLNDRTKYAAETVWRNDVTGSEAVSALDSTEFSTLVDLQIQKFNMLLIGGFVNATLANVRTIFSNVFAGKTNTLANFSAVSQRAGSRAEALWGTGLSVTAQQVAAAR